MLGKTFTVEALATLSGRPAAELEPILAGLARKEMLSLSADPLSPERGQYGFLQDMVRRVAYEMLSKHERRAKHLAARGDGRGRGRAGRGRRRPLPGGLPAPTRTPPTQTRSPHRAVAALRQAGLAGVVARGDARGAALLRAGGGVRDDALEQADLLEHAGMMARIGGRSDEGRAHFERAVELFEEQGATHPAARVSARLGEVMWDTGPAARGARSRWTPPSSS